MMSTRSTMLTIGAAAALAMPGVLAATSPPAAAHMKAHCDQTGRRAIDPITARGSPSTAHNHTFFGARLFDTPDPTRADWSSLQQVGTTCAPGGDHAVYWVPTLRANGAPLDIKSSIAYYGCFQSPNTDQCAVGGTPVNAYPRDLRLVAGDPGATSAQDTDFVSWLCSQTGGNPVGPFSSPAQANCETRAPNNTGLAAHIDFPSCWNRELADHTRDGNTADADGPGPQPDNVVYPTGYPSRTATCPATHPVELPHLRLDVRWSCNDPSGDSWKCESDNVALTSGGQFSLHADFLNGWSDAGMADLLECINTDSPHPHGGTAKCGS